MGVLWGGGELREGEGYFGHLGFQSGNTGKPASASALGFAFAGRTHGSVPRWARAICATFGGNYLEFGVERHMLELSFPVNLYGISCNASTTASSNN
jgi:hypothetical protein